MLFQLFENYPHLIIISLTLILSVPLFYFGYHQLKKGSVLYNDNWKSIDQLNKKEFENMIVPYLARKGYSVSNVTEPHLCKANFVLRKRGIKAVVLVKKAQATLGEQPIAEVLKASKKLGANKAIVISNQFFTLTAKRLAAKENVTLINRNSLHSLLHSQPTTRDRPHRFIERVRAFTEIPKTD